MAFNPDEYLNTSHNSAGGFDPDAYLGVKKEEKPGLWDTIKSAASSIANSPALTTSPAGLALKAQQLVQSGFDKGGEATAETLAGPGLTAKANPLLPFPFNASLAPADAEHPGIKTSPTTAAAVGTTIQMLPDLAATAVPLAEAGMARHANNLATKEAMTNMAEVQPPVSVSAPAPRPTAPALEPLPEAPRIGEVADQTAKKFQDTLGGLTQKAKTQYALGEKLLKIDTPQPGLKLGTPEEIKAAFEDVVAQSKNKIKPALARDPEVERVFGTPAPEPTVVKAMDPVERFKKLWQMDKELSRQIDYSNPAASRGPIELQNQIRAEIEKLPGSQLMNRLRSEYAAYKDIEGDLGPSLRDPLKQRDVIAKVAKSGLKEVAPAGDAAKANAIKQLEDKTGSEILKPMRGEFEKEAAYKAAQERNENVSKAFAKDQRAQASRDAQTQREFDKLSKQREQLDNVDRRLKDRAAKEEADAVAARKERVSKALKYGMGAVGAYKASKLLHLFGE